jgi:hypothetical protein
VSWVAHWPAYLGPFFRGPTVPESAGTLPAPTETLLTGELRTLPAFSGTLPAL